MKLPARGPVRLAIFATHPIQYQCPVWRELARRESLEVCAFFGSDFSVRGYRDVEFGVDVKWDVPLTAGYRHVFLDRSAACRNNDGFFAIKAAGLRREVAGFQPDVGLICGYMRWFWWSALMHLRYRRATVIMRSEATDDAFPRGAIKAAIRGRLIRAIYRHCDRFLALGTASREHYARAGVAAERVQWCPYNIDSDNLAWQRLRDGAASADFRKELGLAGCRTVFLFSGKLIERKDPVLIAQALATFSAAERQEIGLIVLGDGELRPVMEQRCRELLGNRVVFAGFVNQASIGRYYLAADCLVMPSRSRETWGLVVNEAFHFGLPAITSDQVGCARDLVQDAETGFTFPAGDGASFAQQLLRYHRCDTTRRAAMSRVCEARIADYTTQAAADCIESAILDARRLPSP